MSEAVTIRATRTRQVMINTAASQLRRHPGRIVAILLAVMISVGYLTATLSFLATETAAIGRQVTARTAGVDVVVSSDDSAALPKKLTTVRQTPGVSTAEVSYQAYGTIDQRSSIEVQSLPEQDQLRWAKLSAGRWPSGDHQIAIGTTTAKQQGVGPGDTISIDLGNGAHDFTVTGTTDEQKSLFSGKTQTGFVRSGAVAKYSGQTDLLVIGDGSTSADQLAQAIDHRVGNVTVQTSTAYAADQVRDLAQGADVFRNLLLIFGCIALLVGTILIVNTFLILLAQRRRQIGLLRAVGATGSQVRRSLLIEALITGVIGSVLGIGLGVGVAAIAATISGSVSSGIVVPPTVAVAGVGGVLVTVLAAIGPARRATRVSPLEALRPVDDAATARRASVITGIAAAALAVAGGGLVFLGLNSGSQPLLICIAGSTLLAVAVLLGVKHYFPPLLRLIGMITRPFGPVGRLATSNTARNPGRAAATGAALMLATGLIVTLQVGSASVKASTSATFDQHYPVDVTVTATEGGGLPAGLADKIAGIDGIQDVAVLDSAPISVKVSGQPREQIQVLSGDRMKAVINPGAGEVPDDQLLLDPTLAKGMGIKSGDRVTLGDRSTHRTMVAQPSRIAADGIGVLSPTSMAELAPGASQATIWAKATPSANIIKINSELNRLLQDQPDLILSGSLTMKSMYMSLLDSLLTIATVLLGVAVLIALIGVGNTLGLSVIERSRESALLRALGLQRRQLRTMLAVEAVLLAFAGAAVGIAAGAFFGWVGSAAISHELDYTSAPFAIDAGQTIAVAAVAIIAGILASVLPARRAARAMPVDALAET